MAKSKFQGISKRQVDEINKKGYGDEPIFAGVVSKTDIMFALNWYGTMSDISECKDFLVVYYKKSNPSLSQKISKLSNIYDVKTYGWIARMIDNGSVFEDSLIERMNKAVALLVRKNQPSSKKSDTTKNVVNVQDKIRERSDDIIGDIEYMIDSSEIDKVYDYLKDNKIPALYGNKIVEYYTPIIDELKIAISGSDKDIKEAYSVYKPKELKMMMTGYKSLIDQINRFTENVKVSKPRKPRKTKTIPVAKKLSSFKYLKDYSDLQITSVDPTKLIGASEVWLFNTTNNMLTRLNADGPNGFDIKGTSLLNVDMKNSTAKRVGRKAKDVIDIVLNGGKIKLRKVFDVVSAKYVVPTNRTNETTVILKVTK